MQSKPINYSRVKGKTKKLKRVLNENTLKLTTRRAILVRSEPVPPGAAGGKPRSHRARAEKAGPNQGGSCPCGDSVPPPMAPNSKRGNPTAGPAADELGACRSAASCRCRSDWGPTPRASHG